MTERRSLSPMRRLAIFEKAGGACSLCERRIQAGEPWDVEHQIPLALGGKDDESNMRPAHRACHKEKTRVDAASWSKAKRMKARHLGIKPASKWRKPPEGFKHNWKTGRVERNGT